MKKVLLTLFMTTCLAGTAPAGLVAFDFSGLSVGATETEIGAAMSAQYPSWVTVAGATTSDTEGGDIVGMHLRDTQPGGFHQFTISFDPTVPISGVSFDWRRQKDAFYLDVVDVGGTTHDDVFYDISPGENGGSGSGPSDWISFDSYFVKQLIFHDSDKGFIEVGNLVVNAVPLPTSILLGVFAVGLAVRKLRQFV